MAEATEFIVNPDGNSRGDGRRWIACQRLCLRELAPAEVTLVGNAEEAADAAHEAALRGCGKIISVGDSRTAHGVVNGVMRLAESHRRRLKVGFLSLSRPDLWSRTVGLPRTLNRQLELLSAGNTLPFDVGRVECHQMDGERTTRYFLNGASFGVTGRLKHEWRDPGTNLLETLPRLLAALLETGAPGAPYVRLEVLGTALHQGACALGMVMGGRYYPAFGQVAPHADPKDGLLELAWLEGRSWWRTLWLLAGLWLGPLRPGAPRIDWQSVEQLRAVAMNGPVHVEADGELVGRLPATFTVARRELPVIVAPVAARLRKPAFKPVGRYANDRLVGNIKSAAGL